MIGNKKEITVEVYLEAQKIVAQYESEQLEKRLASENIAEEVVAYGDYVQMNDRFETVHIWTKELEFKNNSRWKLLKITKEFYEKEMKESWNKIGSDIKSVNKNGGAYSLSKEFFRVLKLYCKRVADDCVKIDNLIKKPN